MVSCPIRRQHWCCLLDMCVQDLEICLTRILTHTLTCSAKCKHKKEFIKHYGQIVHSFYFYQRTQFIIPIKCTFLISTNFKLSFPSCFGTCVPYSGRTKCQFLKIKCYHYAVIYRLLGLWQLRCWC